MKKEKTDGPAVTEKELNRVTVKLLSALLGILLAILAYMYTNLDTRVTKIENERATINYVDDKIKSVVNLMKEIQDGQKESNSLIQGELKYIRGRVDDIYTENNKNNALQKSD